MDGDGWGVVMALVVALAGATVLGVDAAWWPARRRTRAASGFLAARRLTPDAATMATAERLLVARRRGQCAGGAVVLAAAAAGLAGVEPLRSSMPSLLPLIASGVLPALGGALATSRTRADGDGVRLAHAVRPSLDHFLAPLQRWWPWVALAVAAGAGVAFLASPPAERIMGRPAALATVAVAAATVVAGEAFARWLAARPRPAGTQGELAVRDELTGDQVGILMLGSGPAIATVMLAAQWWPAVGVVGLGLLIVPAVMEDARRRRVGARLWGQPATPPPPAAIVTPPDP